jgi:hypothetical protein
VEWQINRLIDHLFRHESGRIIAFLTRIFGLENIDIAEEENWKVRNGKIVAFDQHTAKK